MAKFDYGGGCPCGLYRECPPGCSHYVPLKENAMAPFGGSRNHPGAGRRINPDAAPEAVIPNAALREIAGRIKKLPYRDLVRLARQAAELCDCERSHNGLGLAGRECDCLPVQPTEPVSPFSAAMVHALAGEPIPRHLIAALKDEGGDMEALTRAISRHRRA